MCKRTMYKRARPMFLWERRACANSGAQAVFPRPKNGLGTRLGTRLGTYTVAYYQPAGFGGARFV